MATQFECKHEVCVAPHCVCPRKETELTIKEIYEFNKFLEENNIKIEIPKNVNRVLAK